MANKFTVSATAVGDYKTVATSTVADPTNDVELTVKAALTQTQVTLALEKIEAMLLETIDAR